MRPFIPVQIEFAFFENLTWLLLAAVVCSMTVNVGLLLTGWRRSAFSEPRGLFKSSSLVFLAIMLGLGVFHVLLWNLYFTSTFRNRFDMAVYWTTLLLSLLAWGLVRGGVRGNFAKRAWGADVAFSAVQTLGLGICVHLFALPVDFQGLVVVPPGTLTECTERFAVTDLGRSIGLYRRDLSSEEFNDFVQMTRYQIAPIAKNAMLKVDPSPDTNCHGWVFSGGEYILRNEDVEVILADNGYSQTDGPELNDVVIYRGSSGQVLHTGKVCGFLNGNEVLIESKWGIDGTYVHLVDQQPYSQSFEYWHTNRHGHMLQILTQGASDQQNLAMLDRDD